MCGGIGWVSSTTPAMQTPAGHETGFAFRCGRLCWRPLPAAMNASPPARSARRKPPPACVNWPSWICAPHAVPTANCVWLSTWAADGVPETLVRRLLVELPRVHTARWPLGEGELRLHRGQLAYAIASERPPATTAPPALRLDLSRAGRTEVPAWRGAFDVQLVEQQGVAPQQLQRCELRVRSGAERFQQGPKRVARSLKKQY